MKLTAENSVALIIDIQSKLLPYIFESEKLIESNIRLINGLHLLNIPIIVTEQYPKGLGETDSSIKDALSNDYQPIIKDTFSCIGCETFLDKIKEIGKKNVIVTGIETHICVMQTVRDLIANDFNPFVVVDCVSSRKVHDKQYGLERMFREGAFPATYESVLMEIANTSKHPNFKELSKIIK